MSKRKINDDEPNIDDNRVLPHIKPYREKLGDEAVKCFCGYYGITVERPTTEIGYSAMECFVFNSQRHASGCKNRGWAWCVSCQTKFTKTNLVNHHRSKKHKMNAENLQIHVATVVVHNQKNEGAIRENTTSTAASLAFSDSKKDA
jgi:hypothetical protein